MSDNMDTDYAEGWRPDPGDLLIGRITSVDLGSSAFIGQYPIITVQPRDGGEPVAVHCFHAALFARVRALKPQRGEVVGFKYQGKRPHKTDRTREVAVYTVKVQGRDADVWGALDGAAAAAPAPVMHPPVPQASQPQFDMADFAPGAGYDDDEIPF